MKSYLKLSMLLLAFVAMVCFTSCAVTAPVCATGNPVGSKVGVASTTCILGAFFFDGGDASIKSAAKNGGISKISTVDFKSEMVFLYFVQKYSTIVTGE